jgi:hypothetical protein
VANSEYTNLFDLAYFFDRLKTFFLSQSNADQLLANKVDKVAGMGLSTNDYTNGEKTKLAGVENNAQVNRIEQINVNSQPQTIVGKTVSLTVPTSNSQLANGAGYINESQANGLIAAAIAGFESLSFTIVDTLPETGESNKIYLIPVPGSTDDNYDEWAYINGQWEHLGSTSVDLSDYWNTTNLRPITTAEIDAIIV